MSPSVLFCTNCHFAADMRGTEMSHNVGNCSFSDDFDDEMRRHGLHVVCPQCQRTDGWLWTVSVPTQNQYEYLREQRRKYND